MPHASKRILTRSPRLADAAHLVGRSRRDRAPRWTARVAAVRTDFRRGLTSLLGHAVPRLGSCTFAHCCVCRWRPRPVKRSDGVDDVVVRLHDSDYPKVTGVVATVGTGRVFIGLEELEQVSEQHAVLAGSRLDVRAFERRRPTWSTSPC
jgi:hypothetical protein